MIIATRESRERLQHEIYQEFGKLKRTHPIFELGLQEMSEGAGPITGGDDSVPRCPG